MLCAHGTQIADIVAVPAGGEKRLDTLALENRAPADVAGHHVMDRP
jgi:hypothetical protein